MCWPCIHPGPSALNFLVWVVQFAIISHAEFTSKGCNGAPESDILDITFSSIPQLRMAPATHLTSYIGFRASMAPQEGPVEQMRSPTTKLGGPDVPSNLRIAPARLIARLIAFPLAKRTGRCSPAHPLRGVAARLAWRPVVLPGSLPGSNGLALQTQYPYYANGLRHDEVEEFQGFQSSVYGDKSPVGHGCFHNSIITTIVAYLFMVILCYSNIR